MSVEAERAILGAILLEPKAYLEAAGHLQAGEFLLDAHRRIYERMKNLTEQSVPIDLITLTEELDRHKELEAIGGAVYVSSLLDGVPDRSSIQHYINIVKDKYLRRMIIRAAEVFKKSAYETPSSEQLLKEGEVAIRTLTEQHARSAGSTRINSWLQIPTLERLPQENVSWAVEGIIPAGVVLWAGESGSYKTWLSLWLAKAVNEGRDFLGRKTVRRPILYLDRENPLALIRERCSILEIGSSEAFRLWGSWETDQPPTIGDRRLLEIARTEKPLIVFDSFIRFHTADENSATEMGRIMAEIRALANAGAVVILQHHKPKADGTQYRGSSDIKAGVDAAFAVSYQKEQETLTFQCFKNRFGDEPTITIKPQLDSGKPFEVTQDQALRREQEAEQILHKIIEDRPGVNQGEIVERAGLPVHKTRLILKRREGTLWRTEQGPRGRRDYYPLARV